MFYLTKLVKGKIQGGNTISPPFPIVPLLQIPGSNLGITSENS